MTTTQTQFLSELKALLRKYKANIVSMEMADGEMHVFFNDGEYVSIDLKEPGNGSFWDDKFYPSA